MEIEHCQAELCGDDIVVALRGFEPDFMLIGNIKVGECIMSIRRLQDEVRRLNNLLGDIGDFAHDRSTGPDVPDALWEIRAMAYQQ